MYSYFIKKDIISIGANIKDIALIKGREKPNKNDALIILNKFVFYSIYNR